MNFADWKPRNRRRFEKWLGDMDFEEKLKTLETGMLVQCARCGRVFYDKETPRERNLRPCKSSKHNCFEFGKYAVLERGFIGVIWFVAYSHNYTIPEMVLTFFQHFEQIRRLMKRFNRRF